MDIDKLFKMPKLPTGGNKRRMPDAPTPEMLKRMKLDSGEAATPQPNGGSGDAPKSRKATVEDANDEETEMAGEDEDFAPGGDADYFVEEDEEGRFYGGGLTSEQKEILNIFDKAGDGDEFEALNAQGVRKLLLRLERAAKKNSDQRSKYPDDPTKFIDSEADLDAAIKALLPLAQVPNVAYPELIKSGQVELLVGLLSHENADIALDVIELLHELTDEDAGDEVEEDEGEEDEDKEAALKGLIKALLDLSILELLVDNMSRFNEAEEVDRQGIFNILGIFENIVGSNPELAERLTLKTKLLAWLLSRIQSKTHDENRGYAAELLSILLQESRPNRLELGKADGVETLLTVVSQFRKRDPVDADEAEYMENVFDSLCSALSEPEIKEQFLKSEGVDLMVLMMKEKMQSRSRCIKTLDHAMSGTSGSEACEVFIHTSGLKHLFSALMGKANKKQKGVTALAASEDTAHALGMLSSLLSNLPSDSDSRVRVLAKFVENNYEKTDKVLDIRATAAARLATVDREIAAERKMLEMDGEEVSDDYEETRYLRRLDGGLFTLQMVDYILAWIIMEDDGIRAHAHQMLDRHNKSFKDIAATLRVFHDNVSEPEAKDSDPPGALSQREILANLIAFVDGC